MQGLLLPHIAPPPFSLSSLPNPPKPLSSFLVSLNSPSAKLSSKLFLRHPSFGFSRCSSRWYSNTCSFDRHLQRNSQKTDDREIWHFHSNVCKMSTALANDIDDLCACHESCENCTSGREFYVASIVSSPSLSDCMKFMFLFGLFTLQDSLPALAGGLQTMPYLGDLGDISTSFASVRKSLLALFTKLHIITTTIAFLLIFFSELGDKTFFIAALLAARNSAAVVFAGTFGALATMTIISVVLGRTFHYVDEILPFRLGGTDLPVDDIAAVCLLVYFGISTLVDASSNDGLKAEDEQKEAELAVSKVSGNGAGVLTAANTVISSFLLVFVAEWGDKSFFSTIALAAASSPLGVIGGALAGHGLATLIAVLGGSLLGTFLSEKVIGYTGGVLFLIFAGLTLMEIVMR